MRHNVAMLLIFPPAAKPCEPPAGIAKLAGALKAHGVPCDLLDMNLEARLHPPEQPVHSLDTWTRRAVKNAAKNLAALRDPRTYRSPDRYRRAVMDVNRMLELSGTGRGVRAGLADYHDSNLSPVRSADLMAAAAQPEGNIYYPYFKKRLPDILQETFSQRRRQGRAGKHAAESFLKKEKSDLIGFSLNYLSQALCTFSMIGFIKREFPGLKIVLGGGLVTSWMKRPGWSNPFGCLVDHLVAGPGERKLLSLLGIEAGEDVHCRPEYAFLGGSDYLAPGFILPYSASSGCYWNRCSFCPEPAERNPYVPVPAEQAVSDLEGLVETTSPILVHLLDSAVSPVFLNSLAHRPLGAAWYGFARFNRELADPDYCTELRRNGCVMLKLGLESGDQDVLDRMRKGIDLGTASRVLNNLRKAGIATYVYLLFGTPAETAAAARTTLDFVVTHREAITFLNLAIFNMPVCSPQIEEYETEPFSEGDLSLYAGFRHPRGWDRKQVRLFLQNEFRRHPAVSSILKRDPPLFTSNHAAFFV